MVYTLYYLSIYFISREKNYSRHSDVRTASLGSISFDYDAFNTVIFPVQIGSLIIYHSLNMESKAPLLQHEHSH